METQTHLEDFFKVKPRQFQPMTKVYQGPVKMVQTTLAKTPKAYLCCSEHRWESYFGPNDNRNLTTTLFASDYYVALNGLLQILSLSEGSLIICTTFEQLVKAVNQWLSVWKERGWKTMDGHEVKFKDMWVKIEQKLRGRKVVMRLITKKEFHDTVDN